MNDETNQRDLTKLQKFQIKASLYVGLILCLAGIVAAIFLDVYIGIILLFFGLLQLSARLWAPKLIKIVGKHSGKKDDLRSTAARGLTYAGLIWSFSGSLIAIFTRESAGVAGILLLFFGIFLLIWGFVAFKLTVTK